MDEQPIKGNEIKGEPGQDEAQQNVASATQGAAGSDAVAGGQPRGDKEPPTGQAVSTLPKPTLHWPSLEALQVFFDGVIAVFTGVLICLAYQQWIVSDVQRQVMRDAFEADTRPWVMYEDIRQEPTDPLTYHVEFSILGKSPARDIVAQVHWMIVGGSVPLDEAIEELGRQLRSDPKPPQSSGTRAPGQKLFSPFTIDQSKMSEVVKADPKKTFVLYILGNVTYGDDFSADRETEFCAYSKPPMDVQPGTFRLVQCPSAYNWAR